MMWTADPEHDFWKWDNEREDWLAKYPKCCKCHEHIQPGDYYYDIDGELYCSDCIDTLAKRMEDIA